MAKFVSKVIPSRQISGSAWTMLSPTVMSKSSLEDNNNFVLSLFTYDQPIVVAVFDHSC